MAHQISKSSIYVTGAARFNYLLYLVTKDRGLLEKEVEHSRFIAFQRGELAHMGDRNWSTIAMCVAKKPAEKMVAVGEDGDVFTYVKGIAEDEAIKPRPSVLRGIGVVEGYPIVCGMKRQVYKRVGERSWSAMHAPAPSPDQNAGFEAIAGFSTDEIYAVGWNGEIWQWNGKKWLQQSSPTNLILTGVCCGEDEVVHICGQNGTLVRGRNGTWESIETNGITDDFWDLCWYGGTLYVSSMTALYHAPDGGELIPVIFADDQPATCCRLTTAEGVMWSLGSDDVFSFDGDTWTRID